MNKPHVLYYDCLNYNKENLSYMEDFAFVETLPDPRFDTRCSQTMAGQIKAIFLPIGFSFPAQKMGKFSKLKLIASNTTTRPDVEADVEIVYLRDKTFLETITSTAEHTLGLILSVHRRIPEASSDTEWNRFKWGAPKMLSRMNLVIWGQGRVGNHLADMAKNIFKNVCFVNRNMSDADIKTLLKEADVLALTMSVEGQQPTVNKKHLMYLPHEAVVVNTARGECLNNDALLTMLRKGQLRGAGLDVLPGDHRFQFGRPSELLRRTQQVTNLIITPHIAGSTEDAWNMTQRHVIDQVKDILT